MEDLQSGSGCCGRAAENFSLFVPLGRRGNMNRWVEFSGLFLLVLEKWKERERGVALIFERKSAPGPGGQGVGMGAVSRSRLFAL